MRSVTAPVASGQAPEICGDWTVCGVFILRMTSRFRNILTQGAFRCSSVKPKIHSILITQEAHLIGGQIYETQTISMKL